MAWAVFAFPLKGVDWAVPPLLAAANKEHDEAEDEHDGSPGEIEVDAHGFLVDLGGVASEEAVECHEASDEEEDEAKGDADIESHLSILLMGRRCSGCGFQAAGVPFCDQPMPVAACPDIGEHKAAADVAALNGIGDLAMGEGADCKITDERDVNVVSVVFVDTVMREHR